MIDKIKPISPVPFQPDKDRRFREPESVPEPRPHQEPIAPKKEEETPEKPGHKIDKTV